MTLSVTIFSPLASTISKSILLPRDGHREIGRGAVDWVNPESVAVLTKFYSDDKNLPIPSGPKPVDISVLVEPSQRGSGLT